MSESPLVPFNGGAPYGIHPVLGLPYSEKSKTTAGVLGVLLGAFGLARFYTGHTMIGWLQLAATVCTCGAGALWGIIDGFMILVHDAPTDAEGLPLRP